MAEYEGIYTKEEYLDSFLKAGKKESGSKEQKENEILKEAFRIALDTRKFEIELYWKRATYFWVIIASAFTGYLALVKTGGEIDEMVLLVAFLGYNFSLAWYFVNRGSKYWQENWEYHVSQLEERVIGPLYKIIKYPEANFFHLTKEYPFSVSRVNQLLSLLMIFVWMFLLSYSIYEYSNSLICIGVTLMMAIINGYIFFRLSRSFLGREKSKLDKFYKSKKEVVEGKEKPKPLPKALKK